MTIEKKRSENQLITSLFLVALLGVVLFVGGCIFDANPPMNVLLYLRNHGTNLDEFQQTIKGCIGLGFILLLIAGFPLGVLTIGEALGPSGPPEKECPHCKENGYRR